MAAEPDSRWQLRAQIRKNVTETLVSLRVNTVDDIQQIAAVLAQCTVGGTPALQQPWASVPRVWPAMTFLGDPSRAIGAQGVRSSLT